MNASQAASLLQTLVSAHIEQDEDALSDAGSALFGAAQSVETFAEAGILTMDNGIVITLPRGERLFITVQVQ